MDSHVQKNAASLAEEVGAELAAELVTSNVFLSGNRHLSDGGIGHYITILDGKNIRLLGLAMCIIVDGKLEVKYSKDLWLLEGMPGSLAAGKRNSHSLADTAIVLFHLYFWKKLGLDSESHGTAVTTSSIYFETVAFKFGQLISELGEYIWRLIMVEAIITSESINATILARKINK
mgnify:CR=1 FL=1